MRECKSCPLSALCLPLGKKKFLELLWQCADCRAIFLDCRRVGAPCFVYEEFMQGGKSICPVCGTGKKKREPPWAR